MSRTVLRLSDAIPEASTQSYTATITDEDSAAVAASQIGALTLTVYNEDTKAVINSRYHQNVLNANNVTVDESGNLEWLVQPADTAIEDSSVPYEKRIALFEWTFAGGTKSGEHEVVFYVRNLGFVS